MTDSDFLWPCSDYLWKMRVIPVCLGKTLWRPSALLCKLWEIRPGAALMRVRSKRHISWICQSGFLNECDAMCIQYERAVCVDTCSEARMCPDSQPAGVSVEPQSLHLSPSFPCAVKEAFIPPPKWVCIDSNTGSDFWSRCQHSFVSFPFFWHSDIDQQSYAGEDLRVSLSSERPRHLHLKRNSSPLRSTPHSPADV